MEDARPKYIAGGEGGGGGGGVPECSSFRHETFCFKHNISVQWGASYEPLATTIFDEFMRTEAAVAGGASKPLDPPASP
jgi:hypothetical protein